MKMQAVWDSGSIRCAKSSTVGDVMASMHIHDVYEIYMVLSNGVKYFVNDRIYTLEPGDVMLLDSMDLHMAHIPPDARYERYVITFPPQLLPEADRAALLECFAGGEQREHRLTLTPPEQSEFEVLAQALLQEQEQPVLGELGQRLALERLLVFLNRISRRLQLLPQPGCGQDPRIRAVLSHIDAHFRGPVTLEELSALCYLNRHYLCRLFKRETGFCIHDYITYRRLACAIRLLCGGESVAAAARLSGFGSDTFFITTFKKTIGTTPSRYARQQREKG